MFRITNNNKKVIIILHEIYGVNRFIKDIASEYHNQGFDIYCPDMLQGNCFTYSESSRAYNHFIDKTGFEYYLEIGLLIEKLKPAYDKVFVLGLSVGATIAWRCCESFKCDGAVCIYGSRIRDYVNLHPSCPVILLFAENDSFDVDYVVRQLVEKPNIELYKIKADHGYMDPYSNCYNRGQALISKGYISNFLERYSDSVNN